MKIISRYVAREFTQNFFLGLGAFSAIYLIVEFFERINAFLYNKATWPLMGAYFLNKFPFHALPGGPRCGSPLFHPHPGPDVPAQRDHGHESRRDRPLVPCPPDTGGGGWIFLALLGLNEFLCLWRNQNARAISDWIIHKKKPVAAFKESQIWIHGSPDHLQYATVPPGEGIRWRDSPSIASSPEFAAAWRGSMPGAPSGKREWVLSDASVDRFCPRGFARFVRIRGNRHFPPGDPRRFPHRRKKPDEMNYRGVKRLCTRKSSRMDTIPVNTGLRHACPYFLPFYQHDHGDSGNSPGFAERAGSGMALA